MTAVLRSHDVVGIARATPRVADDEEPALEVGCHAVVVDITDDAGAVRSTERRAGGRHRDLARAGVPAVEVARVGDAASALEHALDRRDIVPRQTDDVAETVELCAVHRLVTDRYLGVIVVDLDLLVWEVELLAHADLAD